MKKLLLILLISTGLLAKVSIIEIKEGITLYCVDGYVFVTSYSNAITQMYIARQPDGKPEPRKCIYVPKETK